MRKASETEKTIKRTILTALMLAAALVLTQVRGTAQAASAAGIDADVHAALTNLYAEQPVTKMLARRAVAILVFPTMVKAGFLVGAQYGEGALLKISSQRSKAIVSRDVLISISSTPTSLVRAVPARRRPARHRREPGAGSAAR